MTRGAREATFLIGAGAGLAGVVTRLAHILGVRVTPRRTRAHTSPVHAFVLTGYTLGRSPSEAALIITLFIAVFFGFFVVVHIIIVVSNLRLLSVQQTDRLFGFRSRKRINIGEVMETFEVFRIEEIIGDLRRRLRDRRKRKRIERGLPRTRLRPARRSDSNGINGSPVEYQLPFFKYSRLIHVPVPRIDDAQRPATFRPFAPEMHAQERPIVEIRTDHVSGPLEEQRRRGTHRRDQQDP